MLTIVFLCFSICRHPTCRRLCSLRLFDFELRPRSTTAVWEAATLRQSPQTRACPCVLTAAHTGFDVWLSFFQSTVPDVLFHRDVGFHVPLTSWWASCVDHFACHRCFYGRLPSNANGPTTDSFILALYFWRSLTHTF